MRRFAVLPLLAGLSGLLGFASLSGCAVGPDFKSPESPKAGRYTAEALPGTIASAQTVGGEAQRFVDGRDIPAQWWTLFRSPALNSLIEEALRNNPNLQQAEASLRAAQENVQAQQGAYYPSVSANFSPSRQKDALGTLTSNAASGAGLYNLHTMQLNISYAPDLFGGNRRQVESLQAQSDAQGFEREAAYLSLTSNVVAAAVQEAALRAQIRATEQLVRLEQETLDLTRRQAELGAVPEANVAAQLAVLAQTRAQLPLLQKQLAQQRDLIAALAGRLPADMPQQTFELDALHLPEELPLSLPSQLVRQRPDVRAAEEQLHAASADIGVAAANMLPQFNLTAGGGSMATQLSDLFKSGTGFWSLAGGVTQPLFQGGTLLHRKRAAEAFHDAAKAQYRATVIAAFQNVADALHALQADGDALQAAATAEHAAADSLNIAKRQVELGDIAYIALTSAEQNYQQAAMNLVQARANRYADTAALFQALGGGWWNRDAESNKL